MTAEDEGRQRVREARVKYRSDFISRLGVNASTFGFLTPAALLLEQVTASAWVVLAISACFVVAGLALYLWAFLILKELK